VIDENERAWTRLLAETTDPEEKAFYRALHRSYPEITVTWENGEAVLHGIGLK
jgi:hypothetical protein